MLIAHLGARHHQGVVGVIDVEHLLVVGGAVGVLGADHALVEADVLQAEEFLGQVDHLVVQDQAVERAALERKGRHHRVGVDAEREVPFGVDVGRKLLGGREERGHRLLRRPHLFAARRRPQ